MNTVPNDLIGGGDCFLHFHSEDRKPTQDLLHGLQQIANVSSATGDVTLRGDEDFVPVDTTTGNVVVTLPKAINGTEVEVLKMYSPYVLTILPNTGDTILDTMGVTVSSGGAALRFKAIGTDWRII